MIGDIAERKPSAIAIDDATRSLTYRDLWDESGVVADRMIDAGVECGDLIALATNNRVTFIVTALASWRVDASYFAVDLSMPPARLGLVFEEARARFIWLESRDIPMPGLVNLADDSVPRGPIGRPPLQHGGGYVVYTSGSTGKPKGVVVGPASLSAMVLAFVNHFDIGYSDSVSTVANIIFDAHVGEIWPALTVGARLVTGNGKILESLDGLLGWLDEKKVSMCWLPTPVTELLIQQERVLPECVRTLYTAGQRLTKRAAFRDGVTRFENAYGPSETTVITSSGPVEPHGRSTPHIGRPLRGVTVHIVDQFLSEVSDAEVGEILIGGDLVSDGYLRRPGESALTFVPDSFSDAPGAVAYRSGDFGFFHEGNLHFVGRRDDQVKRSGHRIELGDIESALASISGVVTVATVHYSTSMGEKIIAFAGGQSINREEVGASVSSLLPKYMIPDEIVVLRELPLNASGKVDKDELLSTYLKTTMEKKITKNHHPLLRVFEEILCRSVAWKDSFFQLGGTSILSMLLIDRLERDLGLRISYRQLIENETPEDLLSLIESGQSRQSFEVVKLLTEPGIPVPLAGSQRSVVFAIAASDDPLAYHAKARIAFRGLLDTGRFEQALRLVTQRHSVLRSHLIEVDGSYYQQVSSEARTDFRFIDLSSCSADNAATRYRQIVELEHYELFDLARSPLMRWTLIRREERAWELIHTEHHLIHDGWSFNILLRDFAANYNKLVGSEVGSETPPEREPLQYADYAIAQKDWLSGHEADRQRKYWKERLIDASSEHGLPLISNPDPNLPRGQTLRRQVARDTWENIESYCAKRGVTPFAFVYALFSGAISLLGGRDDLCVGSALSNRAWSRADSVIGMVINTVVLRIQVDAESTIDSLVAQAHSICVGALTNQELPFDEVVKTAAPERDGVQNPFFRLFLGFHDSLMPDVQLTDVEDIQVFEAVETRSAKFDLSVVVIPRKSQMGGGDPVHFLWEFKSEVLSRDTVERLSQCFEGLVQQALTDPDRPLSHMELWSPQCYTVRQSQDQTAIDGVDSSRSICEQIRDRIRMVPDAIACEIANHAYTYKDFGKEVGALVGILQSAGVEPGDRVAIFLPRHVRTIACMVAINALDAAYVPLNRSDPIDRTNELISIAAPRVVVCTTREETSRLVAPTLEISLQNSTSVSSSEWLCRARVGSAAYLMFTSGSTGVPKPVVVSNGSLAYFLSAIQSLIGSEDFTRCLAATDFTFDISGMEVYLPLILGKAMVVLPDEQRGDFSAIERTIRETGVDLVQGTPTFWRGLLSTDFDGPLLGVCGGEELSPELSERLSKRGVELVHVYGPTETTIWSCGRKFNDDSADVSFGYALPGTEALVVNENKQVVPPGFVGEMLIGGRGLASGYYNDPKLTSERFIDHPHCDGAKLYCTGDLVRETTSGFKFVSRTDDQIKIRGHRVEIGEVESRLRNVSGVIDAAVYALKDKGDVVLCGVLATATGEQASAVIKRCQQHLEQRLPKHMWPQRYGTTDDLPVLPSGKIDRKAVFAMSRDRLRPIESESPCKTAAGGRELQWAVSAFQEILGSESIDHDAHFFRVGGHSLKAFQLIAMARKSFDIEKLSLPRFMRLPTPRTLAELIQCELDGKN
jgi:amino acid adenylation domain-containing protein